jgi:hypothetical protein
VEAPRNSEEEDFIITLIFMVIIGRRAPPVLEAGARNFMMQLLTIWQGSSSVLAFLAPAKKRTFLSTPVHGLMAQSHPSTGGTASITNTDSKINKL